MLKRTDIQEGARRPVMPVIHIQSLDELNDPALQLYAGLAQHKLRLPHNSAKTHMIVESEIALRVALARGLKPVSFLLNEKKLQALADCLKALPDEAYYCDPK